MDTAREQFLACSARAEQHDRDVGARDAFDGACDLEHFGRGGDHAAQRSAAAALRELPVFRLQRVDVEGAGDDQSQRIDVDRLGVEVPGTVGDRLQRALASTVARGDDHLGVGLEAQDRRERRKALGRSVGIGRQAKIERDDRRLFCAQRVERAGAVAGDDDVIILIGPAQLALQSGIILDNEEFWPDLRRDIRSVAHAASPRLAGVDRAIGSATRKRVPSPSRLVTETLPPIASASCRASNAPIPNPPALDETNGLNN